WFAGHARFVPLGGEVAVAVRNQHSQDWLEHTFGAAVREAIAEVCGPGTAVRWAVDASLFGESAERGTRNAAPSSVERGARHPERTTDGDPDSAPSHSALRAPRSALQADLFGDPVASPKPKRLHPE